MTPHGFLCFWVGLMLGFALMGMLVGVIMIWSDKPKRNCDIGTLVEQYDRFDDYCAEHADLEGYDMCKGCPLELAHECRIAWMNMPYKKEQQR